MTKIYIKNDLEQVVKGALSGISGRALRRAVSTSIKRTSRSVAAFASKRIRAQRLISMKAGTLKKRVRFFDHSGPSKPVDSQYGEVHLSGRPESLARFYGKRTRVGKGKYRVMVSEQGMPYLDVGKSFMVGKVIYTRVGKARLPIKKAYGPSIGALAESAGLLPDIQQALEERFENELIANLNYFGRK